MSFPPFQLPLYRLSKEVGALLAILQDGINSVQRSFRETGGSLLVIYLLLTHAQKYLISSNLTSPPECDIIYLLNGR